MRLALAALVAMCALPAGAADTHPFSVRDMLAMDRISEPAASPDGTRVAFTVRVTDLEANRGRNDVWLAGVDGSAPRRLTSHEASDSSPLWSADGRALFFLSSRSGSAQVWRLALDGGEPEPVTRLPLDVLGFSVVPGGRRLVVGLAVFPGTTPEETRRRLDEKGKARASGVIYERLFFRHWDTWEDGTRNHLFAYDLATGQATDLMGALDADTPTKPFGDAADWSTSPDGTTVVFSARDMGRAEAWSTNFDLYAVPLDGSTAPRKLTTNPAWDSNPRFAPDGRHLAYLAMSRPGYENDRRRVVVRDWTTGAEKAWEVRVGEGAADDRSPEDLAWSADGRELVFTADHLGEHPVFVMDVATGRTRLLAAGGHVASPLPLPGGRVLFGRDNLQGPVELYTVGRDGRDERRVTHLNDAKVAAARFGKAEPFTFTGARGDTVYGWLVRPADFDPARKYPLAFLIHGGPQGTFDNHFHYRWNPQPYAGAGYVAVMVDFHGSTGYGQAFTDAINGDWGGKPYEDLEKGLDYVTRTYGFVDGGRACALGASYGGWMINWIAGHPLADRFRCLVAHDGNLDERSAYYTTEELWFPEWEHGGTPWQNPEGYERDNPANFVQNWKTPTLVVHGGKDFRVVETSGMGTFTALQRRGIPSKFLYFPDENHWVLKPQNSLLWHDTVIGWLDQWTRPAP